MSDEKVVQFKPKPLPASNDALDEGAQCIWVCNCGCSTFRLLSTGEAECAKCDCPTKNYEGGWFEQLPAPAVTPEPEPPGTVAVIGLGSADMAIKRTLKNAQNCDPVAVITIRRDGGLHTWNEGFEGE